MNSGLIIYSIGPVTAKTIINICSKVEVMPNKYLIKEKLARLARYLNVE